MQKSFIRHSLAAIVMALGSLSLSAQSPTPGVVRVKLQPEVASKVSRVAPSGTMLKARGRQPLSVGVEQIDESLRSIKGATMRRVFPCAPEREAEHARFGLDCWYEITYDESVNPLEARSIMRQTPGVEAASARVPMTLYGDGDYRVVDAKAVAKASSAEMPFNDPRLPYQWHYHNDGSMSGSVPGADINLFDAWKISTGSSRVVVAIIDGGVDFTHEDLADNMWVNESELNGTPGRDDDGNGYVDDIYGFNFCSGDAGIYPHNHGTHVSGTVAAVTNNGIGVAGVAGGDGTPGSGVRLMSCQTFDPRSGVPDGDFAAAIIYAADNGATIAQCSWGWEAEDYYEQDVLDAIRYFTQSARSNNMTGGLCIFAAGNASMTGRFFPQSMDEVLCVASMTYDMLPASYSNFGPWVDVTAPGGLLDFDSSQGVLSTLPNDSYGYNEGTSMACPHVSGIAALILSKYGSPSMINENLRQQLTTSVNDFYTRNPLAVGLFGEGYIDAAKALQWGDGSAPEPVTDLVVTPTQEEILLTWTIPASSDNNVNNHILYYATSPFDESSLSSCRTTVIDTKFLSSGDKMTYEITGLEPMTTYYIALKAVNRWNNASALSPVITATTNAGPKMKLNKSIVSLSTTDGATWRTSDFTINNVGEGLLKWSARPRTTYSSIRNYSTDQGLMTSPWKGHLSAQPAPATERHIESLENFCREDFPAEISYYEAVYAFIGDNETTNSLAQLFTVNADEYPDGFNLTDVCLDGYYGINPTIEVYRNTGTLNQSTLLLTFKPSNFSYYSDQALPEQLYFAPGESFYVVAHFTEYDSRNYPLGMALTDSNAHLRSYMSTDLGHTWVSIADALKGSTYEQYASRATWAVKAISKNPDWAQILTLSPSSGTVEGGSSQLVAISPDNTKVPNGTYRAKLYFDTNETGGSEVTLNVNINVAGHKPNVKYDKVVQFGNVLVGQSKTVTLQITNTGYGSFSGSAYSPGIFSDNITCTSPHFRGPDYLQSGIPARSTVPVDVTYAPTEAGSHSGVVIIKDYSGNELRINVQGAATDPAHMVITPSDGIDAGDLDASGAEKEISFTIGNDGNFPLEFFMPKYTDVTYDDIISSSTHRFGYNWISNIYGSTDVAYDGVTTLIDPVDVTSQFGDYTYFSEAIDLGFAFPFYGKTYNKIYISSLGILTFDTYTEGVIYSPVSETRYDYLSDLGVISAYGYQLMTGPDTHIEYAKVDGKFVVNFRDVIATVYSSQTRPISFHIALSPNGDIDIAYDDYEAASVFEQGRHIWVGIVDPDMDDDLTVTSSSHTVASYWYDDDSEEGNRYKYINTGTAFRFVAPKPDMVKAIAPTSGIVMPGDMMTVKATVAATDDMYAGATYNDIVIRSNDLRNATTLVRVNANIVGDLQPIFELGQQSVDFGRVMRTSTSRIPVSILNNGRADMTLEAVEIEGGKFSHDFTSPVIIPAGQSKDVVVTLPTEVEGDVADRMTVTTSAGVKTIDLRGQVIGCPVISLSYDMLDLRLLSGTSRDYPLTITNEGNEDLVYSIVAGNHMSFTPNFEDGSKTRYVYASSLDDASQRREWIDIETTGLGEQNNFTYFNQHDYVAVDLPFEFTFYGKAYTRMYIYNSGFVSFTERRDERIWPEPPGDFPRGTVYTNVIAPYWGLHSMDLNKTAGVYHYVTADQAVVSFIEYGNSMNFGVDFQLILRKDGSFTFNYKRAYDNAVLFALFGLAGISNEDATQSIYLPDRYVEFDSTVNFTPLVDSTLAPGESRDANITVLADDFAGNYTGSLSILTNVPTSPTVEIPLKLNIIGTAAPVFPSEVTAEHTAEYIDYDYSDDLIAGYGVMWYEPFTISNNGKAVFTIDSIDIDCPQVDLGFGNVNMFTLLWYGKSVDDWTGMETMGWNVFDGTPIEVGKTPVKMALPFWQNDGSLFAWSTPGEYDITLTFHLGGTSSKTRVVNVKYIVTEKPQFSIDTDEIRLSNALDADITRSIVTIANTGLYDLAWEVRVDQSGVGETVPENPGIGGGGGIAPTALAAQPATLPTDIVPATVTYVATAHKAAEVGKSESLYNCPTNMEYLRALYYPALAGSETIYNYGSSTTYSEYVEATTFVAPKGGFNITHVYLGILPYGMADKDLVIEVVDGDVQRATPNEVIARATYTIEPTNDPTQSIVFTVPLDRPVFVAEGQEFAIRVSFPVGQPYPSLIVRKEEAFVSNRYMGYVDNYGWFDLAALFKDSYGSLGYILTAVEQYEGDAWIKVLDADGNARSELAGSIAPGESAQLPIRINPALAPKTTDNKAVLVFKTNDPAATVYNLPVYLDKNSAPSITGPANTIYVDEGQSTLFNIEVTDADADDFTVTIFDNGSSARIASAKAASGTVSVATDGKSVNAVGVNGTVTLSIELAAATGTVGTYNLTVEAVDSNDIKSEAIFNYSIAHVNHAPVPVEMRDMAIAKGNVSGIIDLTSLFSDPDGDALAYDLTIDRPAIVTVFRAGNNVIFSGDNFGLVTVTVTATDPAGLVGTNTFSIEIVDPSGVENIGIDTNLDIRPNPATGVVNITLDYTGTVVLDIYSLSGQLVFAESYDAVSGVTHAVDVSALMPGIHLLNVRTAAGSASMIIVIN